MKLIDVSVLLDGNLPTYPGNTPLTLEPIKRLARGDSSNVSTIRMSVHGGTHVDAPRHFFDDRPGAEALPVEALCGPARVVHVTSRRTIEAADLEPFNLSRGERVLVKTANSELWGDPAFHPEFVGIGESAARHLVNCGVAVIGVDYLSVEPFKTPGAPTHHALLGAGVIVIEGLNLRDVEPGTYEMYCLPLRLSGSDGAPARVVLRQD